MDMNVSLQGFEHIKNPTPEDTGASRTIRGIHEGPRKYWEEWMDLFENENIMEKLRSLALGIQLVDCRFRSICWKVFLECLPESREDWIHVTRQKRKKYSSLLSQTTHNPRQGVPELDLGLNNPLSQDDSSPWNRYFEDNDLKTTIKQDVVRTFPEIEFFQMADVQQMMVNILFCYARQHQHVSYRQGMHELLAPIIFVLHSDQQVFLHALELGYVSEFPSSVRDDIRELLSPDFTEHDAFFLFSQVMETVESWYICPETATAINQFGFRPFSKSGHLGIHNVLGVKLCKINEQMLRRHDFTLYNHLESLEIPLHIFGIRWLRLLFGREFGLPDLLIVWDAIFAESLSFDLVDFIFVAMLMCIRDQLLNSDYTQCLSYLMKYPGGVFLTNIIQLALHFKHPMQYVKPCVPQQSERSIILSKTAREDQKPVVSSQLKELSARPRTLALPKEVTQPFRANSEPASLDSGSEMSDDEKSLKGDQAKLAHKTYLRAGNATWSLRSLKSNTITRSFNHMVKSEDLPFVEREMVLMKEKCSASSSTAIAMEYQMPSTKQRHSEKEIPMLRMTLKDCWKQMNSQLSVLQECMCSQKLQRENEMLLALASLKRVRDTLKEAAQLSDMEDEGTTVDSDCVDDWTLLQPPQVAGGGLDAPGSDPSAGRQGCLHSVSHAQEAKKKLLVALVSSRKEQSGAERFNMENAG